MPPQKTVSDLPPPEEIAVYSYHYVHTSPTGGAYIAEIFDSDRLMTEIFLGDGESSNGTTLCNKCIGLRPRRPPPLLHFVPEIQTSTMTNNTTTTAATTTAVPISSATSTISTNTVAKIDTTMAVPAVNNITEKTERRKREDSPVQKASVDGSVEASVFFPHDGYLDETSNYTGFIEIIGMLKCQKVYKI